MQPKRKNASAVRLVGAQVSLFRRTARLTQRHLAEQLCLHEETIASIEQGRRPLKLDLAEKIDELLQTKGALTVAVENLPEIDRYPVWAAEFIDAEQEAIALSWYENQVVPGLLQTEGYARTVFRSRVPALSEDEIEQRVAARLERQQILHRKVPPTATAGDPRSHPPRLHRNPARQPPRLQPGRGEHPVPQICDAADTRPESRGHQGHVGPATRRAMNAPLEWFKSSYSGSEGGACVEVAYAWRKSSYSGSEGGNCIEVASCPSAVHVRDSKDPEGPVLTFAPDAWAAFTAFAADLRVR